MLFCQTPEQVEQEKQKLLSEFADVFTSSMVNTMATEPVDIVWKNNTVLLAVYTEKRLTINLTKLNNQVKRNVHPSKSPREILDSITKSKYFSTLDAFKGYWQVPLTKR